jgi:hypothetical protein
VAKQKSSMRTRSLILLVLLVTLSGCIVTYRDFPIVDPLPSIYELAPPRCRQTVKILAGFGWTEGSIKALQEALQNYGGCSSSSPVVDNSKWAETEVWVYTQKKPPSLWGRVLGAGLGEASLRTGFFFPLYSGQDGWELFYSVYDRNALKKTYKYEITTKAFFWLLVLPFSWINFFTYSFDDAVRSTTAQFVVDAQRDGYLGTVE